MIEVEICVAETQGSLFFLPLNRILRGRFDASVIRDRDARDLVEKWPTPVPGQIVGLDAKTGEAWLREPLFDPEHAQAKAKVEATGKAIPGALEKFARVDFATWAYWLRRAVESNNATIVKGSLPECDGTPVKTLFGEKRDARDERIEKLEKTVERQSKLLETAMGLTSEQRRKLAASI